MKPTIKIPFHIQDRKLEQKALHKSDIITRDGPLSSQQLKGSDLKLRTFYFFSIHLIFVVENIPWNSPYHWLTFRSFWLSGKCHNARDSSRKFRSDDSILTEIPAASTIGCNVSAKNRSIINNC